MFVAPGATLDGATLTRTAAAEVARNWGLLLLNGVLLIVSGFLIFSIDWTIRELATFIGALFIFQRLATALTTGLGDRIRQTNVITGLLSIVTGVVIIAWPGPGLVAVAIGVMRVVLSFEVKRLPDELDAATGRGARQRRRRAAAPPLPCLKGQDP